MSYAGLLMWSARPEAPPTTRPLGPDLNLRSSMTARPRRPYLRFVKYTPMPWSPDAEGQYRPAGAPPILGEHLDGFRNHVTVHAVYNPPGFTGISTGVEPLALHDRAPG